MQQGGTSLPAKALACVLSIAVAALTLGLPASASANTEGTASEEFNFGTIQITCEDADASNVITLAVGETATITIDPYKHVTYKGCMGAGCPEGCAYGDEISGCVWVDMLGCYCDNTPVRRGGTVTVTADDESLFSYGDVAYDETLTATKENLAKTTPGTLTLTALEAGTTSVTVSASLWYWFSAEETYTIVVEPAELTASSVSLASTRCTYSGSAKKPAVTVTGASGETLVKGTDYTVSYSANKAIGTAKVTVTGTGDYTGTVTKTFSIVPGKAALKKGTKSTAKKTLAVKWKKRAGGVSYQIAYKKKGTKGWSYKKVGSSASSKKIKGLTSKKKYVVKVRACKKVAGSTYYGAWSATKTVKVK